MTRYSERERDFEYMGWVKTQRCCVAVDLGSDTYCSGGFAEADHAGQRPYGQKCVDTETIPLCARHHTERTTATGHFFGWGAARMRAWLDTWITKTRDRWLSIRAAGPLPF